MHVCYRIRSLKMDVAPGVHLRHVQLPSLRTLPSSPYSCHKLPLIKHKPPSLVLRAARRWQCGASAATPAGLSQMPWTGDDAQVQALDELKRQMAASPYADEVNESELRWFLLDRKLDVADAVDKLTTMLRWRREFGADELELTDVAKEAATGKAFLHTHPDIYGRPVVIIRAARHVTGAAPLVESQRLCVYILDRAMEALSPGQETLLGIFDLRGFTSSNGDLGFVRFLVDVFFSYYPKRLSQVLFVEAPWVFKPGWEMVKPWLKKYAALVRFVTADEVRREFFTAETVPEDFVKESFSRKVGKK